MYTFKFHCQTQISRNLLHSHRVPSFFFFPCSLCDFSSQNFKALFEFLKTFLCFIIFYMDDLISSFLFSATFLTIFWKMARFHSASWTLGHLWPHNDSGFQDMFGSVDEGHLKLHPVMLMGPHSPRVQIRVDHKQDMCLYNLKIKVMHLPLLSLFPQDLIFFSNWELFCCV